MLTCFAGGLLVAPLCGEPVLNAVLGDPSRICLATALWYLTFYSPQDAFHKAATQTYSKLPLGIIKGLYYPKKILAGLKHSKHVFKGNYLCAIAIATLKGNGTGIVKPFARAIRGSWIPDGVESMRPSVTTKMCVCFAALYLAFPTDLCYIAMASAFVAMKVCPPMGVKFDPFTKLEDAVSPIFFGEETTANQREKKD